MTNNKELYINLLIEKHDLDVIILCETWLSKDLKLINREYKSFRIIDAAYQGVCIISKKVVINKFYTNSEPFMIGIELISKGI